MLWRDTEAGNAGVRSTNIECWRRAHYIVRCCRKSIVIVVRGGRNEAQNEWVMMRTCDKREVSVVTSGRRRVLHPPHQDDRVEKIEDKDPGGHDCKKETHQNLVALQTRCLKQKRMKFRSRAEVVVAGKETCCRVVALPLGTGAYVTASRAL